MTGDPRAELVEVETALAGRLSIPRREALRQRRSELLGAHRAAWFPWPFEVRTRGGAAYRAACLDAAAWRAHAGALFAAEPIVELELRAIDPGWLAELVVAPWLSSIESLLLRGPIGDAGFAALCGSPRLGSLRRLNLSSNAITGDGLAAIERALPALETLVLTRNPLADAGAAALARWNRLGHLRKLYLSACELTPEGLGALLATGRLRRLEKLTLSDNELGDAGATALAAAADELPRLGYLELLRAEVRAAGRTALAAAQFPAMRHLDLR